jgi:hypothetical protein
MTNDDYFLYLTILGLMPYYQKSGQTTASAPSAVTPPGGGTNLPSILEGLGEDGTAAKSSEPGGWGKMSGDLASAFSALGMGRSMANVAMGVMGMAVPALGPPGWGLSALGLANKAADPFQANPIGPYGMGVETPEQAAIASNVQEEMTPNQFDDYMVGVNARAREAMNFLSKPTLPAAPTLKEIAAAFDVPGPAATPGAAWDAMGRPAYGMGEQPGPMTGFTSMPDFAVSNPPGSPTDPAATANPGTVSAGDPSETAGGLGGPGQSDNDPNAGSPEGQDPGSQGAADPGAAGEGGEGDAGGDNGGNDGSGDGGTGGDSGWAKGGVSRARRSTKATYGEAGPETAIFIPDFMKAPGIQGREQAVARALREYLNILAPVGR